MKKTQSDWKKIKNNPKIIKRLETKAKVISAIREFFQKQCFLEVDTPTLVQNPDTSSFVEVLEIKNQDKQRLFLTPSPELFLKKYLAAGLNNIFQITKAYRSNEEKDRLHLKEFNLIEWYKSPADYLDLMTDCEKLISFIQGKLSLLPAGKKKKVLLKYQGKKLDLTPPWPRISCKQAFQKYAQINLDDFLDIKKARKICKQKGYPVCPKDSWEVLYHQVFLNEVEPELTKNPAIILYDYPIFLAALAKAKENNPQYAERFELYLAGMEIANGYSELIDWQEQEKRFKKDLLERKEKKMKMFDYDQDLIEALKQNIPPTAGIALGIDRLLMIFTDSASIQEVSFFSC